MPKEKETTQVIEYDITLATIEEMKQEYSGLKITDAASDKAVRAARTFMVSKRTAVEKRRVELNDAANKHRHKVNEKAKEITALLLPIEEPLQAEVKRVDDEKERIKKENAHIEEERIQSIRDEIYKIQILTAGINMMDLESLQKLSGKLEDMNITSEKYMELTDEANKVLDNTYTIVQAAIATRIKLDKEAEERKAKDERLENVRLEQEALQEKLDEQDKKTKAAQKKIDDEKAKVEDRKNKLRRNALFLTGLNWDGEQYCFMDINVHWTDMVTLSDEQFDHLIKDLSLKVNSRKKEETERIAKEAKEKAEKDAKDKVEKEERERIEKEEAEAKEKAQKEAARPDREKLTKWVESFNETAIPTPSLKTKKAKEILRIAKEQLEMLLQDVMAKVEKL